MINIKHIKLSLKKLVKLWTFFSQFYQDHQDQGDVKFIKTFSLKKKCWSIWQKLAISYIKTLKIKKESQKKELNHLTIDFKKVGQ